MLELCEISVPARVSHRDIRARAYRAYQSKYTRTNLSKITVGCQVLVTEGMGGTRVHVAF
jgi:hypothetical protein